MNNTDVVSSECSYKPRDLDEPLPLPIEPLFGRGPDRPTSPCGVNGQLIDTVRLNGVYEMAPPYTCREAWLAAGAAQIAPVQGRGISHPGKNAVLDRVSIDRPAWRDAR